MAFDWGNAGKGWASTGGSGAGLLAGFFGDNDYEKDTNNILDKIPPELRQYLMPYINAGQGALPHLNDLSSEYESMYKDPNAIISRIGAGYRQSPGYQWKLNQGENAINNAQAAGGMAGTAQHQQEAGQLAGNLADQDYQSYLDKALGLFTGGLSGRTGIEQGIFNTGAEASGSLAASLSKILQDQAQLRYQGGLNKNQQLNDLLSSLTQMFSGGGKSFAMM